MANNDTEFLIQKIRSQYTEKEHTQLDALRELDCKVKRPANIFAYVFGSISAIIMGSGMSLVMTDIGSNIGIDNSMLIGIVTGLIGLAMALVNYPIFKKILDKRKNKYSQEIMKLSDEIMDQDRL